MTAHRRFLWPVITLATLSCHAELERYEGESERTSLIQTEGSIYDHALVYLLVVDDADTTEAAEVRQRMAQTIRSGLQYEYTGICSHWDPTEWRISNRRIVVARPSAPEGESLITPIDMPGLAWVTNHATENDIETMATTTLEALGKRIAMPGETYRPLQTAHRAVQLLSRQRAPQNAAESELMASLPKEFAIRVLVASTRDDADSLPVEQLLPVVDFNVMPAFFSVITPSTESAPLSCKLFYPRGNSRIEQWSEKLNADLWGWPCTDNDAWDDLLQGWQAACAGHCFGRPMKVAPNGVAACRVFIDQTNLNGCDTTMGWHELDGEPQFFEHNRTKMRRCEIQQHTGANLEACRTTVDCPNCPPGYCATDISWLGFFGPADVCPEADVHWPIRFTSSALATAPAWLTILCDTEITP